MQRTDKKCFLELIASNRIFRNSNVATMALLVNCMAVLSQSAADDWPNWRGPNYDGSIKAEGQFFGKTFGLDVQWSKPIGAAYSGVSIADGKVLATYSDGIDNLLGAFDARNGDPLWKYRMGSMYKAHDGGHDGPVSTPVSDGDIVVALNTNGLLVAVDLQDGSERWTVPLVKNFRAHVPFWGFTTTPILFEDLVIVQVAGQKDGGLVAFNKIDGKTRWQRSCGRVDYRSPALARIHNKWQLLVSDANNNRGIDPTTGNELWNFQFNTSNDTTPRVIGDDRVLLAGRSKSMLIQIPASGGDPKRTWSSSEFTGNYDTPVCIGNHLYGFSRRWLTCADLKTGKRRWRSRQPGGKGLILVDGHLVIFGIKGDVVVVEATPEEYREKVRLNVSSADGYATPSFADGTIFVRNLKGDLTAVKTVAAPEFTKTIEQPFSQSQFAGFVNELSKSNDKHKMIDEFLAKQKSFPIVEDNRLIHFVYSGAAEDVGIQGTMLDSGEEDALTRVPGTRFFHRSYEIEPGARWEYKFTVDFDQSVRDPRNRRIAPESGRSEVVTEGWAEPDFVARFQGKEKGKIESLSFSGGAAEVYLPSGYLNGTKRYQVVVVTDGFAWKDSGRMPDILDNLAATMTDPPIVVFVAASGNRSLGGAGTVGFGNRLAKRLIPALDRKYRTRADAESRTLLGKRGAAVAAVFTTLEYPEIFGNCIAISYGRADTVRYDLIAERIQAESKHKPDFYVGWNRYEISRPQSFDCRLQSMELKSLLQKAGYNVSGGERKDSASWRSWRIQAGEAVSELFFKPK